jgi:alginate O-acetyltransferase complex protein AlgJ
MYVCAVLAIAFFFTPLALRAAGVTAHAFENRPLAAKPKLSQGWDALDQTTRYVTDRMPLREQAVRANNWIYRHAFDRLPDYARKTEDRGLPFARGVRSGETHAANRANRQVDVVVGSAGWLYIGGVNGEFEQECAKRSKLAPSEARWARITELIRASGRAAVTIVAPDKGTIYPEYYPDGHLKSCGLRAKAKLRSDLDRLPARDGLATAATPLLQAKRPTLPDHLYLKTDGHWNTIGALVYLRRMLELLPYGVRLEQREILGDATTPKTPKLGDLQALLGERAKEAWPYRRIQRVRGGRKVPGRTVFVGDSFSGALVPQVPFYFTDLHFVDINRTPRKTLVDDIASAHTVILETAEREFVDRVGDSGALSPSFVAELKQRLGGR